MELERVKNRDKIFYYLVFGVLFLVNGGVFIFVNYLLPFEIQERNRFNTNILLIALFFLFLVLFRVLYPKDLVFTLKGVSYRWGFIPYERIAYYRIVHYLGANRITVSSRETISLQMFVKISDNIVRAINSAFVGISMNELQARFIRDILLEHKVKEIETLGEIQESIRANPSFYAESKPYIISE